MHALHAILMRLDGNQASRVKEALQKGAIKSVDDIEFSIRFRVMEATSKYRGGAYNSRSLNDAGPWSEKFPGWGVVLGDEKPADFKRLLQEYARFPLRR